MQNQSAETDGKFINAVLDNYGQGELQRMVYAYQQQFSVMSISGRVISTDWGRSMEIFQHIVRVINENLFVHQDETGFYKAQAFYAHHKCENTSDLILKYVLNYLNR